MLQLADGWKPPGQRSQKKCHHFCFISCRYVRSNDLSSVARLFLAVARLFCIYITGVVLARMFGWTINSASVRRVVWSCSEDIVINTLSFLLKSKCRHRVQPIFIPNLLSFNLKHHINSYPSLKRSTEHGIQIEPLDLHRIEWWPTLIPQLKSSLIYLSLAL